MRSGRRSRTSIPVTEPTTSWTPSRCWTFTAAITEMPGREDLLHVLPALLVPAARRVRVGQLVDDDGVRPAPQDGVEVHLRENDPLVADLLARDDLQVADPGFGLRPSVRLDVPDDDVGPVAPQAVGVVEHLVGLPDAGRHPEVDLELPEAGVPRRLPEEGLGVGASVVGGSRHEPDYRASGGRRPEGCAPVENVEVQQEDVHARLAEEAEEAPFGAARDHRLEVGRGDAASPSRRAGPARARTRARRAGRGPSPKRSRRRPGPGPSRRGSRRAPSRPPPSPDRRAPSTSGRGSSRPRRRRRSRSPAAEGRGRKSPGEVTAWPMSEEPTTFPSRETNEPPAASRKATRPTRPDGGRVGEAEEEREDDEEAEGDEDVVFHGRSPQASFRATRRRSISLIPTNGATRPPRP